MQKKLNIKQVKFITILATFIMLSAIFLPIANADTESKAFNSCDKGPSYKPVSTLEKTTLINFDENSLLDDFAYLSAVPTSVFDNGEQLFSHPLLYYQDEYPVEEEKELTLNARQGLDYFMEDWMGYCNGQMDQMTTINVPKSKVDQWPAKNYNVIESTSPYDIANKLALSEWSYSDEAVISVIDDNLEVSKEEISKTVSKTIDINKDIKSEHFEVPHTNKLNPIPNDFYVPEGYRYIDVRCWYPCISWKLGLPLPGLESLAHVTLPAGDKDLQLYCLYDDEYLEEEQWMQVFALDGWNQKGGMDLEKDGTYIYKSGKWRVTITDIPTKSGDDEKFKLYGSVSEILKSFIQVIYQIDINLYPGERISLFDDVPYDCKNLTIEINSEEADLGFSLIGPGNEKIACDEEGIIEVKTLGQCQNGESYDLAVYSKDGSKGSFEYDIEYSWDEYHSDKKAEYITSATEGAVLASKINAPLLYTNPSKISADTIDTLYKLGVKRVHLVDIGNHQSRNIKEEIEDASIKIFNYKSIEKIYDVIQEKSYSNSIVFSSLDAWIPWYVADKGPTDEISMPGALHVGPAAYIAAHHGTPVVLVDNHPRLSSAVVWHTDFWSKHSSGHKLPSVSEMYLTGKRIYDFLGDYNFDKDGLETIITVAGQFNIGAPWDRVFVGAAKPGRYFGSPVDCAYWISRNIFYPGLIFENPAMSAQGVDLINGSVSHRRNLLPWGKFGLVVDRPSGEEKFYHPVLASLIGHKYRLNEYMENYYGAKYQCADGIIPGETVSFEAIDDGTLMMSKGEPGQFWPDMSTTEIVPFYLGRGGFDTSFSTSFDAITNNLNQGVLMWFVNSHGVSGKGGGTLLCWDPNNKATSEQAMPGFPGLPFVGATKEPNPWRGYDWYLGSTNEPDTLTSDVYGVIPALLGKPNPRFPFIFRTAIDWAPAKKPILDKISSVLNLPIISNLVPNGLKWLQDTDDYNDGLIISSILSKFGCSWYKATYFDEILENIHSTGLVYSPCLLAGKYFQLTMIRHGSSYQVLDPWGTSWYSSFYLETIPRDLALGKTIGQAYTNGIKHVGILYLRGGGDNGDKPQWWWDLHENVCFYGDPDMRQFVPGTDYGSENYWEQDDTKPLRYDSELNIAGHMPFGATDYPHARDPDAKLDGELMVIVLLAIIIVLAIVALVYNRRK